MFRGRLGPLGGIGEGILVHFGGILGVFWGVFWGVFLGYFLAGFPCTPYIPTVFGHPPPPYFGVGESKKTCFGAVGDL